MIRNAMQSLFEAAGRIFSPTDDQYPEIGVQPFEGEPYHGSAWVDWATSTLIVKIIEYPHPSGGDIIFMES